MANYLGSGKGTPCRPAAAVVHDMTWPGVAEELGSKGEKKEERLLIHLGWYTWDRPVARIPSVWRV